MQCWVSFAISFSEGDQEFFESFHGNFMREEREAAVSCSDGNALNVCFASRIIARLQEVILHNVLDTQVT